MPVQGVLFHPLPGGDFPMITFIQFLITGLRLGSVYALIALGYTMVYGIIKLINFAHGDFITTVLPQSLRIRTPEPAEVSTVRWSVS